MLVIPARRSAPVARLRRVAMARGAVPVRTREASSVKVTSRTQCRGRCCIPPARGAMKRRPRTESDRQGELVERGRQPPVHLLLDGKLVVTSTEVLDEAWPAMMILA